MNGLGQKAESVAAQSGRDGWPQPSVWACRRIKNLPLPAHWGQCALPSRAKVHDAPGE